MELASQKCCLHSVLFTRRYVTRVTQFFKTFLTAQRNSGASGEVNYRYLKFISCICFLKLFYILILN